MVLTFFLTLFREFTVLQMQNQKWNHCVTQTPADPEN